MKGWIKVRSKVEQYEQVVRNAVEAAIDAGFVVTVTQVPDEPFAMGNYHHHVEVREMRIMAKFHRGLT